MHGRRFFWKDAAGTVTVFGGVECFAHEHRASATHSSVFFGIQLQECQISVNSISSTQFLLPVLTRAFLPNPALSLHQRALTLQWQRMSRCRWSELVAGDSSFLRNIRQKVETWPSFIYSSTLFIIKSAILCLNWLIWFWLKMGLHPFVTKSANKHVKSPQSIPVEKEI